MLSKPPEVLLAHDMAQANILMLKAPASPSARQGPPAVCIRCSDFSDSNKQDRRAAFSQCINDGPK
jgi:hypothetical protein